MLKKSLIISTVVLVLAGCSTTPITEATGKVVPNDRIYQKDFIKPSPTKTAEVDFFRDAGFAGSGCTHDIFVNNIKVFSISDGEYVKLYLKPGAYFFRLETGGGACPNIAMSQDASLKKGETIAYRILLPSDDSLRMARIK